MTRAVLSVAASLFLLPFLRGACELVRAPSPPHPVPLLLGSRPWEGPQGGGLDHQADGHVESASTPVRSRLRTGLLPPTATGPLVAVNVS
jgi:hypothetical protein